jgi:hypothetical protein
MVEVGDDEITVSRLQKQMEERHGIRSTGNRNNQLPTTSRRKNWDEEIHRDEGGKGDLKIGLQRRISACDPANHQ